MLRHGDSGFTSPPKEGVLWTFVALKNPSPLTGTEPANLDSSNKKINKLINTIYKIHFRKAKFLHRYVICVRD
jgi:hypothetical protein